MTAPARDGWGPTGLELVDPADPPALSRGAVDRAAAHRRDAAWVAAAWAERGLVLRLDPTGATPVEDGPEGLALALAPAQGALPDDAVLLGVDRSGPAAAAVFSLPVPERLPGARGLREVGAALADRDAGLLTTAVGMQAWHAVHPCCPRCGTRTVVEAAGWVRRCPADGSEHFPRTDPAVIVLVTSPDGERAVLGRQPSWPPGRFSCLAGFVEPGESAEQAVAREVQEEAGIAVTAVRPVATQPWPFPASLMLAYRAEADPAVAPRGEDDELEDVRWFTRDEVLAGAVLLPPPVSVANRLLAGWLRGTPD